MAIYHCSVKIISRTSGRSSVAAAAYRAAECLKNEYDGIEHDFTRKNWVEYKKIILPDNAPSEYIDRSTLWNAVEMIEKSQDSQLAREFEVALPVEFTKEQQIEVVETFVKNYLVAKGMIADIAIHNPPKTNDRHQPIDKDGNVTRDVNKMQFINPHAHILCTVRPLDEQGKWTKKSEVEYLCKRDDIEKAFTASEFKTAKEEGWEKQYRYYEGRKMVYYTASEAEVRGLKRVNRTPKTTPFGRRNQIAESWNAKDRVFEWRKQWEKTVNDKFMSIQSDIRIDSRSFKDQGREDELATIHMGTAALNMEKRADREIKEGKSEDEVVRSDIGNINRQIKEHNRFIREFKEKFNNMTMKAKQLVHDVAKRLDAIRNKITENRNKESELTKHYNYIKMTLDSQKEAINRYNDKVKEIDEKNKHSEDKIDLLNNELKRCSFLQIKKKSDIERQIKTEEDNIKNRNEYKQSLARRYNFVTDEDIRRVENENVKNSKDLEQLSMSINEIKSEKEKLMSEYNAMMQESEQLVNDKVISKSRYH